MKAGAAAFFSVLATTEAAVSGGSWGSTLANYGVAGLWIAWFIQRDRKQELAGDRKHRENIDALERMGAGFHTALKGERDYFAAAIESDTKARYDQANALNGLTQAFATAGIKLKRKRTPAATPPA